MKDFKTDARTSEGLSFDNTPSNENAKQCGNSSNRPLTLDKAVLDDGGHGKPDKVDHRGDNSSNYFEMSSLSPIHEEAINELLSLANTRNSSPGRQKCCH